MSYIRTEPEPQPRGSLLALFKAPKESVFPSNHFINVEKNLASLGFFTPSHKKIRGVQRKTVPFSRQVDGKRVEVRALILPSAAYGLPITADQDKYFALQKIIADLRRQNGEIKNPVGFTSAELLRVLGLRLVAGKDYGDVMECRRD